ncbi:MAG: hypothetical protein DWQ01_07500 [Planctomycetota bacterium]|nr:MAG: hypothetical protein DWQ01_07500 [Planctomycetota bacterium]
MRLLPLCLLWLAASPLLAQYPYPLHDASFAEADSVIFLDQEVMHVTVTMDEADLDAFLADRWIEEYARCTVRFQNSKIDETLMDVGIRPRGFSARSSKKFPWKLSFTEFVPGRKFHGLKKFNLGGDATDPSLCRSTLTFRIHRAMGVPAPRTHHVWLTINDGRKIKGTFINFEQVDDEFVDAWFGNDTGDLYKCRNKGPLPGVPGGEADLQYIWPGTPEVYRNRPSYEEKINDENFVLFANFVDFINNADDAAFRAGIGSWLNVDGFLRAMAVDMTIGGWDGYWIGANNYYLYWNVDSQRFEYLPWDTDHTFGMDYVVYPIYGDFGNNWAARGYYNWGKSGFGHGLNATAVLIARILSIPAYDQALMRYVRECKDGPFSLDANDAFLNMKHLLLLPYAFQGVFSGLDMDWLYTPISFTTAFEWPFEYERFRVPCTWGLKPFIRKRMEKIEETYPFPQPLPTVRVNEAMADNDATLRDEAGEFEDWVELYNYGASPVDLSGMYLSDQPGTPKQWQIPAGTVLSPGEFLLFWCDNDLWQGSLHTNFKLSKDGDEGVYLFDTDANDNRWLASLHLPRSFSDQSFGMFPDGSLHAKALDRPTPRYANWDGSLMLDVLGDCPGTLEFNVIGASPYGQVAYLVSQGMGNATVPTGTACEGLVLGLDAFATLAAVVEANENGTAIFRQALQAPACGRWFVQAVDLNTCQATEVHNF